jgi:hypothetical protein
MMLDVPTSTTSNGGPTRECNMEWRKGNLVAKALKEKCISADIKALVGNIEIWEKVMCVIGQKST